jgi:hypothetical protein
VEHRIGGFLQHNLKPSISKYVSGSVARSKALAGAWRGALDKDLAGVFRSLSVGEGEKSYAILMPKAHS